ncbi:MAG: hypothetical protein ACI9TV_001680 [Sulfurimonas sp.]|jgi:hypothetical protein|uniref:hypothetical protein n=1 Tax=Sulfurimonas sp. TaxID=2022749 RepID=UPI0039E2537B
MNLEKCLKKSAVVVVLIALFTGCSVKTIAVSSDAKQNLSNKTFTFVKRTGPLGPQTLTPGKALAIGLTGGVGAAIMGATGGLDAEELATKIPGAYISTELSKVFEEKYKMIKVLDNITTNESDIDELVQTYDNVDYLIDTQDLLWQVVYYPFNWGTYSVRYIGTLKLIDINSKKILAQGQCQYFPDYTENAPTYDEIFLEDSKLLKQMTKEGLDVCIKKYITEVL